MKTLEQLQQELDAPIPRSAVKEREGAGRRSFSYLSTDYVIDRNNKLFGNLNWSSETTQIRCVHEGQVNGKFTCHYIAQVKVEAQHINDKGHVIRTSHMGVGYGDGADASNPGKAHELAAKEAESDALKRASKNFGQSMGLALYSKDQENVVEDDKPAGKSSPAPGQATPSASQKATVTSQKSALPDTSQSTASIVSTTSVSKPDRETLNKNIGSISKIVLAKGKATQDQLVAEVKKHGADRKEDLSDESAQKLFVALKSLAS